jgi:serine/threonine-protein kinase
MDSGKLSTDLLFAYLALQNALLSRDEFVLAMNCWLQDKSTSIKDVIRDHGWLDEEACQAIEQLMEVHLQAHQGQLEQSLHAVASSVVHDKELQQVSSLVIAHGELAIFPPTDAAGDQESAPGKSSQAATILPNERGGTESESTIVLGRPTSLEGRYQVLRAHAKGGLGQISIARDNELNREVALKEILADHLHDDEIKDRFYREAQITGRLEHPGIVPVYGMGEHANGNPYYVMRFVRGEELKKAIDQFHDKYPPARYVGKRRVEFIQLLRQFTSVCHAIGYAHSRGILHRDIKPANVLLGKFNETFIIDWGLAKPIGEVESPATEGEIKVASLSGSGSSQTQMHSTLGTPGYMSPEQADGLLDELGPASDVYSLGATLYYLLTRKASISGTDLMEITDKIRTGNFPPPRSTNSHVPAALEAICLHAMELVPEDRYQTPQQLAVDIESWIADETVSVYPESLAHRFGRWMRRHRSWALATAASLVIIAVISSLAAVREKHLRVIATAATRVATDATRVADENREKAKEYFQQAQDAMGTITGASEILQYYPKVTQLRIAFVNKVAEYWEKFADLARDDPDVQMNLGLAYLRLGDTRRILNQLPQAEHAYKQAGEVFTDLKEAQPDNLEPERALAASQIKLAILYQLREELDQSSKLFRETTQQLRDIGKKWPKDTSLKETLAVALLGTAALQLSMQQTGEAETPLVEAIGLLKELQATDAKDAEVTTNLAKALLLAGRIKNTRGQVDQAAADFQKGIGQFDQLIAADPENPDYLKSRADGWMSFASTMQARGDSTAEANAYQQAQKSYQKLMEVIPGNPQYKETSAMVFFNLGLVHFRIDDLPTAENFFHQSALIYKELFESLPIDSSPISNIQEGLAANIQKMGQCDLLAGDLSSARIYVEDSMRHFTELVQQSEQKEFVQRLAIARRRLADVSAAEGKLADALVLVDESIVELAGLIDLAGDIPQFRSDHAAMLARKGELLAYLDRPDEALACWQEARKEWEHVLTQKLYAEKQFLLARLIVHHPQLHNGTSLARAADLAGKCVEQTSSNPRYQNLLAHIQLLSGKLEDADRSLAAARQARQHPSGLDDLVASLIASARDDQPAAEKHAAAARSWFQDVQPGNPRMKWLLGQFLPESP